VHTAALAAVLCHRASIQFIGRGRSPPTDFDLLPNSHTQPWSAVSWSPLP